ncbi:homoserine kinase-like [Panicum virgatum]|uniref:homoserine kinase-like n=1 Tax=Panicum virgatum TaxID=38727 RepID=UPI0019D5849F|nr:homoserine kinase-like [Panicum virgatum]
MVPILIHEGNEFGFDFLGCAVADASLSLGDTVTATLDPTLPPSTVSIACPHLAARLSKDSLHNCAGVGCHRSASHPRHSAVDALFGSRLERDDLILASLESEKAVSGFHVDNITPTILGGFVLVRSYEPFHMVPLASPPGLCLHLVLLTPDFEAPTSKMRAALPKEVGVQQHVRNLSQAAALVAGVLQGGAGLIGSAMSLDGIVEPNRAPLIPGMVAVKAAVLQARGCTISGAGSTAVAVIDGEEKRDEVGGMMVGAFWSTGKLKATAIVVQLDRHGARVMATTALG